jgi:hypothetical protein
VADPIPVTLAALIERISTMGISHEEIYMAKL